LEKPENRVHPRLLEVLVDATRDCEKASHLARFRALSESIALRGDHRGDP
jgi:predicted ATPase